MKIIITITHKALSMEATTLNSWLTWFYLSLTLILWCVYNIPLDSQEGSLEWLGHVPKFTQLMWGIASVWFYVFLYKWGL